MEEDLEMNMDSYRTDIAQVNDIVSGTQMESNSRSLLGNCEITDKCGNSCFGMCGPGCTCWSWVCGDCSCWLGCYEHDTYCSCDCMLSFCCLDIFWVKCDGSGSC